jgi:hypothetical protein
MSLSFSLLKFKLTKFDDMNIFIDKRDEKTKNTSINNLPSKLIDVKYILIYYIF